MVIYENLTDQDIIKIVKKLNRRSIELYNAYGADSKAYRDIESKIKQFFTRKDASGKVVYNYTSINERSGAIQIKNTKAVRDMPRIESRLGAVANVETLRERKKKTRRVLKSLNAEERKKRSKDFDKYFDEVIDFFSSNRFDMLYLSNDDDISKFLTRGKGGGSPTYEDMFEIYDKIQEEGIESGEVKLFED